MQPHEQTLGDGYRIRVGRAVPSSGVNIAYIGNTIENPTSGEVHVIDNLAYTETNPYTEVMYADSNYQLISSYQSGLVHSENILITNVFTEDTNRIPLYYEYELQQLVPIGITGTYNGADMTISKLNAAITDEQYKIVLYESGYTGLSRAVIYTNFQGDRYNIYHISYRSWDDENQSDQRGTTEIMDLTPVFSKVDKGVDWPGDYENQRVYALEEVEGGGFRIYVPIAGTGQPVNTRTPEYFKYKIDANFDINCSHGAPRTLKIGMIVIEAHPGSSIRDTLRSLYNRVPQYLTLKNPHPYLMQLQNRSQVDWIEQAFQNDRDNMYYWMADINMPRHHMFDYDLIIIAGRGTLELSTEQINNIEAYLENGGAIWLDNNGLVEGSQLQLDNFPADVQFGYDDVSGGTLSFLDYMQFLTRYNVIAPGQMQEFGDPKTYISSYDENIIHLVWREFDDATPTYHPQLSYLEYESKGKILASSVGLMMGVINNRPHTINMVVNILLRIVEHGWRTGGYLNASVLEKASLLQADYKRNIMILPYDNGYSNDPTPKIVARKRLMRRPLRDIMQRYIPQARRYDTTKFKVSRINTKVKISPAKDFYDPHDIVYAYTDAGTSPWQTTSDNISVRYPNVTLKFTVDTFVYSRETNVDTYTPYDSFSDINSQLYTATINAYDGIKHLGPGHTAMPLSTVLPGERAGKAWVDKSMVYYRIRIGEYVAGIWKPATPDANIYVYDTATERYIVHRNGEIIIAATDVTDSMVVMAETHAYEAVATNDYAVKTLPSTIQLREPVERHDAAPWYLRIRHGNFSTTSYITNRDYEYTMTGISKTYRYRIPEFYNQIFNPAGQYEIMKQNMEVATFIDNNLVRVTRTPMAVDTDMPITVKKREHSLGTAYNELLSTTDGLTFHGQHNNWMRMPAPIIRDHQPGEYTINHTAGTVTFNDYRSDIRADYTFARDTNIEIAGYDRHSGIIQLNTNVDYTDNILVSYHYKQRYYVYRGYDDGTTFWHLDLNPSLGHFITYETESGLADIETYKLIGETVYVYMLPYTDGTYTNDSTIRHTFGEDNWNVIQQAYPQAVLLGKVQVRESSHPDNLVVFDTRTRGGGLQPQIDKVDMDKTADAHKLPSASEHYWDVGAWSGSAYQTQGVSVFTLPKTIKSQYGGQFNEDHIIDITRKQLALGIVPVINYAETDSSTINSTTTVRGQDTAILSGRVTIAEADHIIDDTINITLHEEIPTVLDSDTNKYLIYDIDDINIFTYDNIETVEEV